MLPYYLVWLFAVAATVYMKSAIVSYTTIGRALGRIEVREMTQRYPSRSYLFSTLERLSFYRADFLLGFVVLPVVGFLVLYLVPRRWRMPLVVAVTYAVIACLYLQMNGYWLVGQFQSGRLWLSAVHWGWLHPEDAWRYAVAWVGLKLGIGLVTVCAAGVVLARWQRKSSRPSTLYQLLATGICIVILAATALSWCSRLESTPYHRSALGICARALAGMTEVDLSKYDSLGSKEAIAKWREITRSPEPKPNPDFFGLARGSDVIAFILETAPARCLGVEDMDDLPNIRRLTEHAWVASSHVTTYPYTSSALFSLLTSWYPSDVRYLRAPGTQKTSPGMMRSLAQHGYATAAYKPFRDELDDDRYMHAVGISDIVLPEHQTTPSGEPGDGKGWHEIVQRDRAALERMKKDLAHWIREDRRYAVLFLPQIGHAPWVDVIDDGIARDPVSRGRAIIALQDQWLGELLDLLRESGRLEHTVFLVMGDHGIRTRMEDPSFEGGNIGEYSFHVPCVLSAPTALDGKVVIPWTTSHIDLAPSILDLLGVSDGRELMLGSPMWDERIRDRTTFLFAGEYLGADGFHERGTYGMWKYMSGTAYSSSTFDFRGTKPLMERSAGAKEVLTKLSDALALQHRITRLGAKDVE